MIRFGQTPLDEKFVGLTWYGRFAACKAVGLCE